MRVSKEGRERRKEVGARTRQEVTELPTVVLAQCVEHNGTGMHIYTHVNRKEGGREGVSE